MGDGVDLADEGLVDDSLEKVELPPAKKTESEKQDPAVAQEDLEEITPSNETPKTESGDTASLEGLVDMGRMEALTPEALEAAGGQSIQVQEPIQPAESENQDPQDGMANKEAKTDESAEQNKDGTEPVEAEPDVQAPQEQLQVIQNQPDLEPVRVLEAALFLANKPLSFKQLQDILQTPRERINVLLQELGEWLPRDSAVSLMVNEHGAALQLKPQYVERVAKLSKEVELSRKAMRILALVAKKKQFLQSELKHYFRGEIYAYVTELKQSGYIESKKSGNTRLLKPTTKFFESFQLKE